MTVLGTAEHATPDTVSVRAIVHRHVDGHLSATHVGDVVILSIGVFCGDRIVADALAAAEHIAVKAVQALGEGNVGMALVGSCYHRRQTDLAAGDIHHGFTRCTGYLTAAIHVVHDMAAFDVDGVVVMHQSISRIV